MAYRSPGAMPQKAQAGELLLALHDFEARSGDELSLSKGDKIELIERDDEFGDGWYLGRHTRSGITGLFPEVYTAIAPKFTQQPTTLIQPLVRGADSQDQAVSTGASPATDGSMENVTPSPLNTGPSTLKHTSASNPTPASTNQSSAAGQRTINVVQQDASKDSPVLNETLSVIDEHMTDMNIPRQTMQDLERHPANDSGSEYSTFFDPRKSYIAGHETDEEEQHIPTEKEVSNWTPSQVAGYLEELGVEIRHCQIFKEQEITGEVLLAMDQASIFMKEFDLGLVGQRLRTWQKIKAFQGEVRNQAPSAHRRKQSGNAFRGSGDPRKEQSRPSYVSLGQGMRSVTSPTMAQFDRLDSPAQEQRHVPSRDSGSTPSIFGLKSGMDSPNRPSAASIRELNHSRRHSAAEFSAPFGATTPSDQASPLFPQGAAASSQSPQQHKKAPSLDQTWTMGIQRPPSAARTTPGIDNPQQAPDRPPFDPELARVNQAPTSPNDTSDRGYKSGDELEGRKSRNVLRKRDQLAVSHSRQSSFASEAKRTSTLGGRRHSRFSSVDSIKETVAALTSAGAKAAGKGHFRNSSANEALRGSEAPTDLSATPAVTKLNASPRPSMKLVTETDGDKGVNGSPKSSQEPTSSAPKARVGLRAISDAVTSGEKADVTSPVSIPSPVKESARQSPTRTGSTTPSGTSQNQDRESTDASSKGTGGATGGAPAIPTMRKKHKHETSAYIRGLEQKTPKEAMADCDYSGWMKKKSSNLMTTWKSRLFILRGRRLSYYYSEDDTQEKGLIDISGHRVLPADSDILTGIHATVTGAKSSPVSPATTHTPTLAATQAAAQEGSPLDKVLGNEGGASEATFIFKLVPPRSGLSRAVNFTKPTIHYFAVDNIRQGRLWMAALMKATIHRDETMPVATTYQQKTISLAKARSMKQRPPALMNLDERGEGVGGGEIEGAPKSDETGLNIGGLNDAPRLSRQYSGGDAEVEGKRERERESVSVKKSGSLDGISKASTTAKDTDGDADGDVSEKGSTHT